MFRVGAVDSALLLTGSADWSAKLWDVESGETVFTWTFKAPCKAVAFNLGETMMAASTDPFQGVEPAINIIPLSRDSEDQTSEATQRLTGFSKRINRVAFTDCNRTLISAGEDGFVRRWDVEVLTCSILPGYGNIGQALISHAMFWVLVRLLNCRVGKHLMLCLRHVLVCLMPSGIQTCAGMRRFSALFLVHPTVISALLMCLRTPRLLPPFGPLGNVGPALQLCCVAAHLLTPTIPVITSRRGCVAWQVGKEKEYAQIHQGSISDLQMSKDGTHFVTAGYDNNAQLVDTETLAVMKVYPFGAHANSAALSPIFDHVRAVLKRVWNVGISWCHTCLVAVGA